MGPIITAIVLALKLGAKEGLKDTSKEAIKDSYKSVKNFLAKKFGNKVSLEAIEKNPESDEDQKQLEDSLNAVEAEKDNQFLEIVQSLINVIKEQVPNVNIKGINIYGDANSLTTRDSFNAEKMTIIQNSGDNVSQFLPQAVLIAMQSLAEKDKRINELEAKVQLTFEERKQLKNLTESVRILKKSLQESNEGKKQLEKDKQELEKHLTAEKDKSLLKNQALIEIDSGDYEKAEIHLKEAAKKSITESAETFYQLGKVKKLQLDYSASLEYFELATKIDSDNILYLMEAASICFEIGNYNQSISYYEKIITIEGKNKAEDAPEFEVYYKLLGVVIAQKGEFDKALNYFEKGLAISRKNNGEDHEATATCYYNIGSILFQKRINDQAIVYTEKAITIFQNLGSDESESLSSCYNSLASVYADKGDFDRAISLYENALNLEKDDDAKGSIYNNFGMTLEKRGDYDKALHYLEKAVDMNIKSYGEVNPDITQAYNNIGLIWEHKGDYNKAISYYEKALVIDRKFYGEQHPNIAMRYSNIGQALYNKGEYDKAISYYDKALIIDKLIYGDDHPSVAMIYNNIGQSVDAKGDYDNAIDYFEKALVIDKKFMENNIHVLLL